MLLSKAQAILNRHRHLQERYKKLTEQLPKPKSKKSSASQFELDLFFTGDE